MFLLFPTYFIKSVVAVSQFEGYALTRRHIKRAWRYTTLAGSSQSSVSLW